MPRVKSGVTAHRRHKKILKLAKGYRGARSKQFKKANETVMKALYYARRDRRAQNRSDIPRILHAIKNDIKRMRLIGTRPHKPLQRCIRITFCNEKNPLRRIGIRERGT